MYRREATYPVETSVATYSREALSEDRLSDLLIDHTFELYGPLEEARSQACQNIRRDQTKQQARYAHKAKPQTYLVNDPVLLFDSEKDKTRTGKLEPNWTGPFYIQSVLGKGVYRLRNEKGEVDNKPINAKRLKLYRPRALWEPRVILEPSDQPNSNVLE